MPNRYSSDDRDEYYNEGYRDREYGNRSGDFRDYEERFSREPRGASRANESDERYGSGYSSRREPYEQDRDYRTYRSRDDESRYSSRRRYSTEGQHRGKGPKGYTRSDDRIKEDVSDALMEDPELDASDIEVTVKKGEVVLQGQVASRRDKRKAEDCADACAGVLDIQNNLKIRSETSGKNTSESRS